VPLFQSSSEFKLLKELSEIEEKLTFNPLLSLSKSIFFSKSSLMFLLSILF